MKAKSIFLLLGLYFICPSLKAQTTNDQPIRPVKNVILMITDGTSLPVLSASRWMQRYRNSSEQNLNIDPYLCGTLVTYSSNAPIGDSAPTTSCYMTGIPSITGFIATYPFSQAGDDLFPLDPKKAYSPMATILEVARLEKNRKVGLVMTSEFCHATPADCSAHSYDRKRYDWLIPQMVHNSLDVVIGGGAGLLTREQQNFLKQSGYTLYLDQIKEARKDNSPRTWQLYGKRSIPYNIDRDTTIYPSLAEMTESAIKHLTLGERSENGFFLMVEGSKVDWAAHDNDAVALVNEFTEFDKAVGRAIEFAKRDGNTVVIVTSDHGNSGFSIARQGFPKKYDEASKEELFGFWSKIKRSADGMAQLLNQNPSSEVQNLFQKYCGFQLDKEEIDALYHCEAYENSPLSEEEKGKVKSAKSLYNSKLSRLISSFVSKRLPVGFTTHGHTGEDVFLAIFAPKGVGKLVGVNQNYHLTKYMETLLSIEMPVQSYTPKYFAPHTELLKQYNYRLTKGDKETATLTIKLTKKKSMEIKAYSNVISFYKGKKLLRQELLPLASVYVDKTDKIYISADLLNRIDAYLKEK